MKAQHIKHYLTTLVDKANHVEELQGVYFTEKETAKIMLVDSDKFYFIIESFDVIDITLSLHNEGGLMHSQQYTKKAFSKKTMQSFVNTLQALNETF